MTVGLDLDRQRWGIILVWLVCLVVNIALVFWLDFSQYRAIAASFDSWRDPINKLYLAMFSLYGAPLTTMLAIAFARKKSRSRIKPSLSRFIVALCISLIWNLLLIAENIDLSVLQRIDIQSFTDLSPKLAAGLSFMVTPILAFYFSSEAP